ncbi:MAG: sigma-54-dependent Fis family transcriptional regulator, partial [Deltaproteobacteria bacterium]|nr:sigma-54-dependent Fis family transcriptional regulator [Deltaproteobacteria bacterium]
CFGVNAAKTKKKDHAKNKKALENEFGEEKEFTGNKEQADGGTLFLDEIGEMPLHTQVKLLRALQEKEVTRVGDTKPRKVDIRVIAATHKNLFDEVVEGKFREDLMHRLAVAVLQIPPLRQREGDIAFLADKLLEQINKEAKD